MTEQYEIEIEKQIDYKFLIICPEKLLPDEATFIAQKFCISSTIYEQGRGLQEYFNRFINDDLWYDKESCKLSIERKDIYAQIKIVFCQGEGLNELSDAKEYSHLMMLVNLPIFLTPIERSFCPY